jgi:hypothetical protein
MSEWNSLTYSKSPLQCNHCGNKTSMKIVTEKRIEEYYYYDNVHFSTGWREWLILKCPLCQKINVIENSLDPDDEDVVVENGKLVIDDEDGGPKFAPIIRTTSLYPISDWNISVPNPDMPLETMKDYNEAKLVFPFSTKSSAALLRLAVQKLCKDLGEKGKNINDDIKSLVKKGLPLHIQQALDIVRVIGNESVHPGEINVNDTPEIAKKLFDLVNEIVDDRISKPKRQAEIAEAYQNLPEGKREEIRKRDSNGSVP